MTTRKQCITWTENHKKDPITGESIIPGSYQWYYWSEHAKTHLDIDVKQCHSTTGKPLVWFQDGKKVHGDNSATLCITCNKLSRCMNIVHKNDGNIECLLCGRMAKLIYCCILCVQKPSSIQNEDSIEQLMFTYMKELRRQGIRQTYRRRKGKYLSY